jgi:hypothetical protein
MPTPTGIALAIERKLTVLKASLEHHDAGALRKKYIYKILDDLDIGYTTRERSIYRGTIDGKVALLYRQVDNIAVACSDSTVCSVACSLYSLSTSMVRYSSYGYNRCQGNSKPLQLQLILVVTRRP